MNRRICLGRLKIEKYSKFTLYKIFKKQGNIFIPIYQTTLQKNELKKYENLEKE